MIVYNGVSESAAGASRVEVPSPTGDDRKQWRMVHRGHDGGRRADVTVRPCSLLVLYSLLVILRCAHCCVGLKKRCCHVFHITTCSPQGKG